MFIAGRPGHGKTTFMINMLRNMIDANPDKSFVFYSYEENRHDILLKYMLSMTDESNFKLEENEHNLLFKLRDCIRTGKADDFSNITPFKIKDRIKSLLEDKRLIILNPDSNVESLSESIIKITEENKNIGAIYIDYVQKLTTLEKKANRQQEVQNVCKISLETALKVGVPIILGSQVNREVESIDTFNASNMREAGDIEQDANIILGIWDNKAAKISKIEKIINDLEEKKIKAVIEGKTPKEYKDIEEQIKNAKEELEKLQLSMEEKNQPSMEEYKKIKILKNRNGKSNITMDITSHPNRFLFINNMEDRSRYLENQVTN